MIDWVIALLAAGIGFVGIASEAFAQPRASGCGDCRDPFSYPIDKAFHAADAIFVGEVVGLRPIDLGGGLVLNEISFSVSDRYAGPAQVDRVFAASDCGYTFSPGDVYLVWAQANYVFGAVVNAAYAIVPCSTSSRTAPLSSNEAQDDLEWLKINVERDPGFREAA